MTEQQAQQLTAVLGGYDHYAGDGVWLCVIPQSDGRIVVIDLDCVLEYASKEAFERGESDNGIWLVSEEAPRE